MGSLQEKVACGRNVGDGRSWETAWDCEIGLGLFLPCERSFIWVVGASGVYECVSGYSPGWMERRCAMQTKTTRHVSKSSGSSGHGVTGHTVHFCVLASDLDKLKQRSAKTILRGRRSTGRRNLRQVWRAPLINSRLLFRARRAARLAVDAKYGNESLAHRPNLPWWAALRIDGWSAG
jgi:hypothetical protein